MKCEKNDDSKNGRGARDGSCASDGHETDWGGTFANVQRKVHKKLVCRTNYARIRQKESSCVRASRRMLTDGRTSNSCVVKRKKARC